MGYMENSIYGLVQTRLIMDKSRWKQVFPNNSRESFPYQISAKSVKLFMGSMKVSIYCLMQNKIYYASIWLKIGMAWYLMDVSHIEFQRYLQSSLYVHLWFNVNQALLQNNMAENWNCLKTFSETSIWNLKKILSCSMFPVR
jgi:hypothetical protein